MIYSILILLFYVVLYFFLLQLSKKQVPPIVQIPTGGIIARMNGTQFIEFLSNVPGKKIQKNTNPKEIELITGEDTGNKNSFIFKIFGGARWIGWPWKAKIQQLEVQTLEKTKDPEVEDGYVIQTKTNIWKSLPENMNLLLKVPHVEISENIRLNLYFMLTCQTVFPYIPFFGILPSGRFILKLETLFEEQVRPYFGKKLYEKIKDEEDVNGENFITRIKNLKDSFRESVGIEIIDIDFFAFAPSDQISNEWVNSAIKVEIERKLAEANKLKAKGDKALAYGLKMAEVEALQKEYEFLKNLDPEGKLTHALSIGKLHTYVQGSAIIATS